MTDKPSWQAAGFHSPNKQWRQSCRIKARIGQNFRGETVDATRRESADAKKCRMGMTPNDFLFKIRYVFNDLQGHFSGPTMSMKQGAILKAGAGRTSEANRMNHCTIATFRYVRGLFRVWR
jgi:hypothetical protein